MFFKNNSRYFEHNPYIEIVINNDTTLKLKLCESYMLCYRITSFKFIRPERFVMSSLTQHWFIHEFLPRCHMDDFTFEVCLSTVPAELHDYIKQYLKYKEGLNV